MWLVAVDQKWGLIGSKRFRSNPTPRVEEALDFVKQLWPEAILYGPLERVPVWCKDARMVSVYLSGNKKGEGRTMRNWIPLAASGVSVARQGKQ